MFEVDFYRTKNGTCPVEHFLDSLGDKEFEKVAWVLTLIEELDRIPVEYLKKLSNTDDIWEIRIKFANNSFRILGFITKKKFIILTNGFEKQTKKTPKNEIKLAENRKKDFLQRSSK